MRSSLIVCAIALTINLVSFARAEVDFDSQIRPLLSDKCFHCHGPDESTREAGLRLDQREAALEDLGGYAAVIAGVPDESELIRRIESDDPDELMPPPESKIPLTENDRKLLRDWIEQGAPWTEHWSFVPLRKPEIPEHPGAWARGPIDQFILDRASEAGIQVSPATDRATLLRRVTFDLTGLPPTIDELDAFLADDSENAYEKVVDRLLASPRYGERMAWDWLDASRYADTDGFQGDPTRSMWPWRDWLVNALNENMPFDQFTLEMLAGDLLPNATAEQILATGFNRNHMFNGEGGRIAEETRVENVFDRAETTGTVWLGLTMTCCRCHDHKYDPISQEEYFQLYAFFDNTSETGRSGRGKTAPVLNYLPDSQRQVLDMERRRLANVDSEMHRELPAIDAEQRTWEIDLRAKLQSGSSKSTVGPWWQLGPLKRPARAAFDQSQGPEDKVDLKVEIDGQKWVRSKAEDGKVFALPATVGPTYFYRTIEAPSKRSMMLSLGSDDAIKVFLNGKEVFANYALRAAAADQDRVEIQLLEGRNDLLVKIVNVGGIAGFYCRTERESVLGLPVKIVDILSESDKKRNEAQRKELREYYRSKHWTEWKSLDKQRSAIRSEIERIEKSAATVMVMDDLPEKKRRRTFVLDRGGYDKPTDQEVHPGTPSALPPLVTNDRADRLDLANWLVHPDNPLTARVTVNRYWQTFFGRGIVKSSEDFGSQGSRPSHPELLDYLATEFISNGWNVKSLHKEIVMSATYCQSSRISETALEKDPENIWFARAPRMRMPSWMLRDQALAASGLLQPTLGGPSVRPYQPEGIWAEATFGKIKYKADTGEKLYRRSLYIFWRRIVGPTMFFDGAKRQTCEVKPSLTNTPLHALTTLNETTFVESARAMAERVVKQKAEDADRVRLAFRLATSRLPNQDELSLLLDRIKMLQRDFAEHPDDADRLLSVGESARDESLEKGLHASYTLLCSMLLNLDESLTRH